MYMQYVASTNSTTILSLRESFNITVGPVTSLAASPDGTLLYVLSPNKVMYYKMVTICSTIAVLLKDGTALRLCHTQTIFMNVCQVPVEYSRVNLC